MAHLQPANDQVTRMISVLPRQVILDLNTKVATVKVHEGKTRLAIQLTEDQTVELMRVRPAMEMPDWFRAKVTDKVIEDARP